VRERHLGLVRELGVQRAVDVDDPGSDLGEGTFDVVIDTVGGEPLRRSFAQLRRGGRLVTLQGPPDPDLAAEHGVEATFFVVEADRKTLAAVSGMVNSGQLHIEIAATFPLRDGAAAYRSGAASPRAPGKTVLVVIPPSGEPTAARAT
jgi:NADPH:quinone reductase-like Zn-dependent oxidoreductase